MSRDAEEPEPPPKTLAWLEWYSKQMIGQINLTPEEARFAHDKGGKIIDFAMKGFWPKQKKRGIRFATPAIACAYALAWLEQWAKSMEEDAVQRAEDAKLPMNARIEKIIHGVAKNQRTECAVVAEETPLGDVSATIRYSGDPADFQLSTWRSLRLFLSNLSWTFWGANANTLTISPEPSTDYTADQSAFTVVVRPSSD